MKTGAIALAVILAVYFGYRHFIYHPPVKNARPTGESIICFGDSLTYGTGASQGMDYPSQLSRLIGRPVINAGIPGDTTATALARLDRDVLSLSPRIVLITLGGNDLKNRQFRDRGLPEPQEYHHLHPGAGSTGHRRRDSTSRCWGRAFSGELQEGLRRDGGRAGAGLPEGPARKPRKDERCSSTPTMRATASWRGIFTRR